MGWLLSLGFAEKSECRTNKVQINKSNPYVKTGTVNMGRKMMEHIKLDLIISPKSNG